MSTTETTPDTTPAPTTDSLYERLGGDAGIEALVDHIVDLHLGNPTVATRFTHADQARARAMGKEFFKAGSGGPNPYTGKAMPDAHGGMNISEEEYMAVVDDMLQALTDLGYGDQERADVLSIAWSLKGDIVRV